MKVKSTPILYSAPMVRAYQDGKKTETRKSRRLNELLISEMPSVWFNLALLR